MGISKFFGMELIIAILIGISAVPKTNLFIEITKTEVFAALGIIFLTHVAEVYLEHRGTGSQHAPEPDIPIDDYP